ncbi:MAG: hypothetical protein PHN33_04900 [Candidatus Peribacteraceae bacterium]|nr:hypothetical protein [Candidatus Peribacteraceae bacterium]
MTDSQEAFPAYEELLSLTRNYGGVEAFERKLAQARDMATNANDLEIKGIRFSAQGRRIYGCAHGAQDFVDAAQSAFDAANRGDMRAAEEAAKIARQYQRTFFNLFNRGFDPRSGRRD